MLMIGKEQGMSRLGSLKLFEQWSSCRKQSQLVEEFPVGDPLVEKFTSLAKFLQKLL